MYVCTRYYTCMHVPLQLTYLKDSGILICVVCIQTVEPRNQDSQGQRELTGTCNAGVGLVLKLKLH